MAGSKAAHNPWYIALVIYNIITWIAVVVFNVLNSFESNGGLFITTPEERSRKYPLDITPADWTFNVWWVVYAWQGVWLLYSLVNLFRKNRHDQPLYASPYVLPPLFLGVYVIANGCDMARCFLLDRGYIGAALAASLLTSVLLVIALTLSYRSIHNRWLHLLQQRRELEVWLVRGLVHNGLGLYAAWVCLTSVLQQLATVLVYADGSGVSLLTSSTIALGVLALGMGVFVLLDAGVLDRYSRYTLTPYAALVVGLLGVVLHNWDLAYRNSVFAFILCVLACVFLVLKVVLMVVRHVREGGEED